MNVQTENHANEFKSRTRRFELAEYDHEGRLVDHITAYVTVAWFEGKPRVVTFSGLKSGSTSSGYLTMIGHQTTSLLGAGVSWETIAKSWRGTRFGPSGWVNGHAVTSLLDAVAQWVDPKWWELEEKESNEN